MKKILILCVVLLSFSCDDDKEGVEMVMRVKENKVSCSGYEGQTECYLVQQGDNIDTEDWEYFYEQIQGFSYQPGFVYKLSVRKMDVENPMEDQPHVVYYLIKEISKEPR
jgi:hypothetical protein